MNESIQMAIQCVLLIAHVVALFGFTFAAGVKAEECKHKQLVSDPAGQLFVGGLLGTLLVFGLLYGAGAFSRIFG